MIGCCLDSVKATKTPSLPHSRCQDGSYRTYANSWWPCCATCVRRRRHGAGAIDSEILEHEQNLDQAIVKYGTVTAEFALYGRLHCLPLTYIFIPVQAPAPEDVYFSQSFSTVPLQTFPGGTYKMSNTKNFPTSHSMSGSLVNLTAGGMREPHWHDPIEWAYVLSGTCR